MLNGRLELLALPGTAVPPTLLMAVALPEAYGVTGTKFAGAYLVVNLWCLAIQGRNTWGDPASRSAWLQYLPLAALAPLALFAGSFLDGGARVAVWSLVAAFNVGSALAAGRQDEAGGREWSIEPTHFAERHALFVIISLGEVLVAVGAAAAAAAHLYARAQIGNKIDRRCRDRGAARSALAVPGRCSSHAGIPLN